MKELEARTGVSREAIRFYIREGLLPEPEKPRRNVALYSEEHVARTRLIKELQDKHFLPLKMVKAVLDAPDSETLANTAGLQGITHLLPALLKDTSPSPDRPVSQILAETGLDAADVERIAGVGGITIRDGKVDFRDVAILAAWAEAREAGFDSEHGYDESFFRVWVEAARALADFEVSLFVASYAELDAGAGAKLGARGIDVANRIFTQLHTRFIIQALAEQTSGTGDN